MNDKLFEVAEQLSKQASDWVDEVHPHVSYRAWHNYHKTKFAELIVRECTSKIIEDPLHAGAQLADRVRKHFGVE